MKNRTVIGIICIVVAVIITFVIAPLINNITNGSISTVRLNQDVKQGSVITVSMLEEIEISKKLVNKETLNAKEQIVGKYAASNLYSGDVITKSKLTEDGNTADDVFSSLDGSNVAISVTVDSLASGLSGKLQNGDIVSFIITRKNTNQATTPAQLRYMKVINIIHLISVMKICYLRSTYIQLLRGYRRDHPFYRRKVWSYRQLLLPCRSHRDAASLPYPVSARR